MSGTVETILLYTIGAGLLSIVYGFLTGKNILNSSAGNAKMQDIASAIQIGAKAYLARQYKTIAIVGAVVLVIVSIAFSPLVGLGYLIGAALSGIAGYVGMLVSVEANVRTAEASRKGLAQGLSVAFKSGAVTGMLVAGLALLAIAVYYYILLKSNVDEREIVNALVALGFGASLISIFARLGGGIFTKGADVGADLVGKVEAGIPEDDPRNPAVIADNVGDNVGDCAGMAADLFETYAVTIVATMVLSSIFFPGDMTMMIYPLTIGGACILTSILGTFFVKLGKSKNVMNALYKEISDEYEVVIFVGNRLDSIRSYNGMAQYISNNEPGLSFPIYSSAECFGSSGKLRGNLIFPSLNSFFNSTTTTYDWGDFTFVNAPLLHELFHLWGGADILPYHQVYVDEPGAGTGHFGFSTGGILGGFNNESLKELGNNDYQVDYFYTDGNGADTKMGNIEKYIMGLLPSSELGDLYAFIGNPIVVDLSLIHI